MKYLQGIVALICIFAVLFISAVALESFEERSPVEVARNGTQISWDSQKLWGGQEPQNKFSGFYYDINDNMGTESLTMNINEQGKLDGDANPKGIIYKSDAQEKDFKFNDWGKYLSIGFLGENYFAGYVKSDQGAATQYLYDISGDANVLQKDKLLRVLRDDDSEVIIKSGTRMPLGEGYEIEVKEIDSQGNKANLELFKDGQKVGESTVSPSNDAAMIKDSTYYLKKDIGDIKGIVVLAVHFKNSFHAADSDAATLDGIFQISENPESVMPNAKYDRMRIASSSGNSIVMDNRDGSLILAGNQDLDLLAGIHLRTADQNITEENPLRLYIYKMITEPGKYEIRSSVKQAVEGADIGWDASSFPGFFYDLDNDLGAERLVLNVIGNRLDGSSQPKGVVYRSQAQESDFKFKDWGKYYSIGFLGEKCFAGYVQDASNPEKDSFLWYSSKDGNLMAEGKLSRVLIDSDEEQLPLAAGSVIPLKEGYEIHILQIDTNGNKVVLALSQNGKDIDNKILDLKEESTYCYKKMPGTSNEIVTIAVHFRNAFASSEANVVTIRGIWQISENTIPIDEKSKIGSMTIQRVDSRPGSMSIEMDNEDRTILLGSHKNASLMGDFYLKTADQDDIAAGNPLRLYIYRSVTIGGAPMAPAKEVSSNVNSTAMQKSDNSGKQENAAKKVPGFLGVTAMACLLAVIHIWRRRV